MASSIPLPLDQQFRTVINSQTKKQETVKAIDKSFKQDREFVTYQPPPISILAKSSPGYQASVEEYEQRLTAIQQDLKWLLSLPYQGFWCQVIYDISCQRLIDSYLKFAPRSYDVYKMKTLPVTTLNLLDSIHKQVFLVCLRMSTYKESQDNFLSRQGFASLIYENFLFDMPRIFDLCVLYRNNPVLGKLIENLFSSQEKYYQDFKACVDDIIKAIETSKRKLRELFELGSESNNKQASAFSLSSAKTSANFGEKLKNSFKEIFELIYYFLDLFKTLGSVLKAHPTLLNIAFERNFQSSILSLAENTVFEIMSQLKRLSHETKENADMIKIFLLKLRGLKSEMLTLFHQILVESSLKPMMNNLDSGRDQTQNHFDNFFRLCYELLEEKHFLCYYEEKFGLVEQVELVFQMSGDKMDESQFKHLIEMIKTTILTNSKKTSLRRRFETQPAVESSRRQATSSSSQEVRPSTSGVASNDQEASHIQSVRDLFPDMDVSLIKKCLEYYNNNVDNVINAVLENNLPVFTSEIEASSSKATMVNQVEEDNYYELNQRKNVFDNDEFDVFNKNNVDLSRIHMGKKDKKEELDAEFNKEFYKRLESQEAAREYEDEYDDTYDDGTQANEVVDEPELLIKPLNQKLNIKKRDMFEDDEEDDDIEQELEEPDDKGKASSSASAIKSNNPRNQFDQRQQQPDQRFSNQGGRYNRPDYRYENRPSQGGASASAGGRPDALPQRKQYSNRGNQPAQRQFDDSAPSYRPRQDPQPRQNQAQRGPYDNNNEPENQQGENRVKTEEEIKRDRKWKNDNKAKTVHHNRKDLAAKKMNRMLH